MPCIARCTIEPCLVHGCCIGLDIKQCSESVILSVTGLCIHIMHLTEATMAAYWRLVLTDTLFKCLLLHACVHRRCCLRLWTKLSRTRDQKTAPWHQYSRSLFTHLLQRLSLLSRLIGSYNGWECVSAPDKYTIWDDTHTCGHGLTHNDQYDRHALARRRQKELQTRVTQSNKFVGMPNFRLSIIKMWHVQ